MNVDYIELVNIHVCLQCSFQVLSKRVCVCAAVFTALNCHGGAVMLCYTYTLVIAVGKEFNSLIRGIPD